MRPGILSSNKNIKVSPQQIRVRDPHLDFDSLAVSYFDSENAVLTHEWTAFALIVPPGERYFIRSINRLAHLAKTPLLKQQIHAFVGQEAMHSQETDRCLEAYEKLGFPMKQFQKNMERRLAWVEKWLPFKNLHLAITAASEHYTTIFSLWHLLNRYCDAFPTPIRDLCQWHSAEELEHRAVAFDLLQETARHHYILRVLGFFLGIGFSWLEFRRALRMLLKTDGYRGSKLRVERNKARKIRMPLFSWRFPLLWRYLRPGYHPNEIDDDGAAQAIFARQGLKN